MEMVLFFPLFFLLFAVQFALQWAMNASMVHQQATRDQVFHLYKNSRHIEFRHREINGETLPHNNFYIGYSSTPFSGGGFQPTPPEHMAAFEPGSFSIPKKVKVYTVFGICTQTHFLGGAGGGNPTPWIPEESTFQDYLTQDPKSLCR